MGTTSFMVRKYQRVEVMITLVFAMTHKKDLSVHVSNSLLCVKVQATNSQQGFKQWISVEQNSSVMIV